MDPANAPPAGSAPTAPVATPGMAPTAASERRIRFNAVPLDARGLQTIVQLETHAGTRLVDGDYWYDPTSGISGPWGGGGYVLLPAGLPLGGPLPAHASGGGDGRLTGVFVNGRELHPNDVATLRRFIQVVPGRYWFDARGNVGIEGGQALFNVYALAQAQQAQQSGGMHTSSWGPGKTWVGGGASGSSWGSEGGRITNDCSYDPSDGAGVVCSKTQKW